MNYELFQVFWVFLFDFHCIFSHFLPFTVDNLASQSLREFILLFAVVLWKQRLSMRNFLSRSRFLSCCFFAPFHCCLARIQVHIRCTVLLSWKHSIIFNWYECLFEGLFLCVVCGSWCGSICCSRIRKVCHIFLVLSSVRVQTFGRRLELEEKVIFLSIKFHFEHSYRWNRMFHRWRSIKPNWPIYRIRTNDWGRYLRWFPTMSQNVFALLLFSHFALVCTDRRNTIWGKEVVWQSNVFKWICRWFILNTEHGTALNEMEFA